MQTSLHLFHKTHFISTHYQQGFIVTKMKYKTSSELQVSLFHKFINLHKLYLHGLKYARRTLEFVPQQRPTYLTENDLSVIFPVPWSIRVNFKQQRVGGHTSYLIPVIFTNSWSYKIKKRDTERDVTFRNLPNIFNIKWFTSDRLNNTFFHLRNCQILLI